MPLLVVTRGERGAVAIRGGERAEIRPEPIERVVDTTGAGDLFAAGFLYGQVQGRGLEDCLRIGAIAAAEVISHYGARPEARPQGAGRGAAGLSSAQPPRSPAESRGSRS